MKCLGLHNKPTAEAHSGHMLTGPREEEEGTLSTKIKYNHLHKFLGSIKISLWFEKFQKMETHVLYSIKCGVW
jgi:hypothetical protein